MTIFLSILLFFIVILSFPVRIFAIHSPTVLTIRWLFLKMVVSISKSKTNWEYFFLGLKLKSRPKKEKTAVLKKKKKTQKKKSVKKSKVRKLSISFLKEIIQHPLIKKILKKILNLLKRLLKSVSFRQVSADIGLNDYYLQGIVHGFSHRINSKQIQIRNNYLSSNHLEVDIKISIWGVLYALLIFLGSFPYFKTFRFYKNTLLEK
jgi:hypothetical protein